MLINLSLFCGHNFWDKKSCVATFSIVLTRFLFAFSSRTTLSTFFFKIRHYAMFLKIINIESFKKLSQFLISFFQLLKEFLSVRPCLGGCSCDNMLLHPPPLFSIEFKSDQKPEVLILSPSSHPMLLKDLTFVVYFSFDLIHSIVNTIEHIITILVAASDPGRCKLSLILLKGQIIV